MEAHGYSIDSNILFHDNQSTILFANNGRSSSSAMLEDEAAMRNGFVWRRRLGNLLGLGRWPRFVNIYPIQAMRQPAESKRETERLA